MPPADRPDRPLLPQVLWGECISGAMYISDFEREARKVGFIDPRILTSAPIQIHDPELQLLLGEAKFFSITYRSGPWPSPKRRWREVFLGVRGTLVCLPLCADPLPSRLFKLPGLIETLCEDYGQYAVYKVLALQTLDTARLCRHNALEEHPYPPPPPPPYPPPPPPPPSRVHMKDRSTTKTRCIKECDPSAKINESMFRRCFSRCIGL